MTEMAGYDWWVTVAALAFYALIEAAWITTMRPFYDASFLRLQPGRAPAVDVAAAVLAYAVLFPVVYLFVVHPIATHEALPWPAVLLRAAAFGLAVYGVYNLTNKATRRGYTWGVVLVDTVWGVAAMVLVALVALWVAHRRK